MNLNSALLESWNRQGRIVNAVSARIDESTKNVKPSPDGWSVCRHLAHMHEVRRFHLYELDPHGAAALGRAFSGPEDPIQDLDALRQLLVQSEAAVNKALREAVETGTEKKGGYDHPMFLMQHLVFHEGWHLGLIFLALRLAGQEIPEPWEERHVWGEWRTD